MACNVFDLVWCLFWAGWEPSRIDHALRIGHARDCIVSSWASDEKRPSDQMVSVAVEEATRREQD